MAFENVSFATEEVLTSTKMNKLPTNDNFLFDRLLPQLLEGCVAGTGLGFYVVRFALINPNDASGSGLYGATWTKLWQGGGSPNSFAMAVGIPNTIFSATPFIVGHVSHSQGSWGIHPVSIWGESATGFSVAFKDSGGEAYQITGGFGYTALLLGARNSNPT